MKIPHFTEKNPEGKGFLFFILIALVVIAFLAGLAVSPKTVTPAFTAVQEPCEPGEIVYENPEVVVVCPANGRDPVSIK